MTTVSYSISQAMSSLLSMTFLYHFAMALWILLPFAIVWTAVYFVFYWVCHLIRSGKRAAIIEDFLTIAIFNGRSKHFKIAWKDGSEITGCEQLESILFGKYRMRSDR